MRSNVIGAYKQIQIHGPIEFAKDVERVYICKGEITSGNIRPMVKEFC